MRFHGATSWGPILPGSPRATPVRCTKSISRRRYVFVEQSTEEGS
jgi:hypothetical protein